MAQIKNNIKLGDVKSLSAPMSAANFSVEEANYVYVHVLAFKEEIEAMLEKHDKISIRKRYREYAELEAKSLVKFIKKNFLRGLKAETFSQMAYYYAKPLAESKKLSHRIAANILSAYAVNAAKKAMGVELCAIANTITKEVALFGRFVEAIANEEEQEDLIWKI